MNQLRYPVYPDSILNNANAYNKYFISNPVSIDAHEYRSYISVNRYSVQKNPSSPVIPTGPFIDNNVFLLTS
jgi:hypothetical protein